MAKKDQATEVAIDPKYAAVLADMSEAEKKHFLSLADEEKDALIALSSSLAETAVVDGIEFKDIKPVQENINILSAGGIGLRAGTKFVAKLLGTVHVFSKEFKENWKEFKGETATYYANQYYKFEGMKGGEFGIWASPTLRMLEKLPTHAATPSLVKENPIVEITYVGKIEGRERLLKEFGLEIKTGISAHVFITKVAGNVQYNAFVKGAVNSLNSPVPMEASGATAISREEATRSNYEKLMALQGNSASNALTIN